MRWSSQYCLFVWGPNIGTGGSSKWEEREEGGKSWSYPKPLGMEGDKVNLVRLTRASFCVTHVGGERGTKGGHSAKGMQGQFPPGHALLRSDEKKQ